MIDSFGDCNNVSNLKKTRASVEYYIDGEKNKFPQLNNKIILRNRCKKKKNLKSSLLASSYSKLMPKDLEHYN